MKQDLYIFIFNKIKIPIIAYIFAQICYFFLCVRYEIQKMFVRNKNIQLSYEEALKIVNEVCPEKEIKVNIFCEQVDKNVDLSIICPIYNYETVIKGCIESMINQKTKYKYEIILIDDGSNQPAKLILKQYEMYSNITIIYQENKGISSARNTGINHAKGKYLMFVDCDDVIADNCVEILLDEVYKTNNDIVIGSHNLVKEKNGKVINVKNYIYSQYNINNYEKEEVIMNYPGLPWGKVYKRELFEDIRFPEGYWYEDTIIQFLIFRKAKSFSYIPKIVYEYKWYEGNYSKVQSKSNTRVIEHFWIYKKMIEENDRIGLPKDKTLYVVLLKHLGSYLYNAIKDIDIRYQQALFVMSKQLLLEIRPNTKYKLNFELKEVESAINNNDFNTWILICKSL